MRRPSRTTRCEARARERVPSTLDVRAVLAAASLIALGASVAACASAGTALGRRCEDDSQCGPDAPICVTPGVCATSCTTSCSSGFVCQGGGCVRCGEAGSVAPDGECLCNSDCRSGQCDEGVCVSTCVDDDDCADGEGCRASRCEACADAASRGDGDPCVCASDCASGLSCSVGFCGVPCEVDEQCGASECRVDFPTGSACAERSSECAGSFLAALGAACACNADCAAGACVQTYVEGFPAGVCRASCGVESPCASGASCCFAGDGRGYCFDDSELPEGVTCDRP